MSGRELGALKRAAVRWENDHDDAALEELQRAAIDLARAQGWTPPADRRPRCTCDPEIGGRLRCPTCGGWAARVF
jgi:hypothetical protein